MSKKNKSGDPRKRSVNHSKSKNDMLDNFVSNETLMCVDFTEEQYFKTFLHLCVSKGKKLEMESLQESYDFGSFSFYKDIIKKREVIKSHLNNHVYGIIMKSPEVDWTVIVPYKKLENGIGINSHSVILNNTDMLFITKTLQEWGTLDVDGVISNMN